MQVTRLLGARDDSQVNDVPVRGVQVVVDQNEWVHCLLVLPKQAHPVRAGVESE